MKKSYLSIAALLALAASPVFASTYAIGGTEATVVGTEDVIHTFLEDGIFTLTEEKDVRILLVGGGGGGGRDCAGGGGAGGFIEVPSVTLPAGSYSVTVGQGGAGGVSSAARGGCGTSSIITAIDGTVLYEAFGGGGGGAWGNREGLDGASGGGGTNNGSSGSGIEGQGHAGGQPPPGNAPCGGGGAGGEGFAASGGKGSVSGDGGPGKMSDITGVEVYYAGGGAGGSYSGTPGQGGIGGGGNGIPECSQAVALGKWDEYAGADGFGGGGGGGNNSFYDGAEGGSGVVIFRLSNIDSSNPDPSVAFTGIEQSNFAAKISGQIISAGMTSTDGLVDIELQLSGKEADFSGDEFTKDPIAIIENASGAFCFNLVDLQPDHTYFFRIVARNDAGNVGSSSVLSFTTPVLDEPIFTNVLGYEDSGLLQYYHPAATSNFTFDEYTEGLVLMPGTVMAGVGGSGNSVYGGKYTDSLGNVWTFASRKSYGYLGYMWMDAGSTYNFFEHMGDSCRIEINDEEVLNDSGIPWDTTTYLSYQCQTSGWYRIKVKLGGSSGNAGNCAGGWSFAFGYNVNKESTCSNKPGGDWSMLENTEDSTFLWPFKPGRTIDVVSYTASATDASKLAFSLSLGETTAASDVWAVWGDTYQGEATNDWDNIAMVGTYAETPNDITFDIPSDAKYIRFFSVQDWGVTSWTPTTFIDLTKTSILGLGVSHAGDQGTFSVRVNSVGEGDLTVSLQLSTNADMSDAIVVPIEGATAAGTYEHVQALNPSTTYYYNFVAETTEGGYDETSVGTFTTLEASSLDTAPTVSVNNRTITYAGNITYGAGETTITIWGGDSADSLEPKETIIVNNTATSYQVKATFPDLPHKVYTKLVVSNVGAGGTVWTTESSVFANDTVDAVTYTLRADVTEGKWNDPSIWNHSIPADGIVTGFPSNWNCSVSFTRNNADARIEVDGHYVFSRGYFASANDSTIVIYGDDVETDILQGDFYGGKMQNTEVSFENINVIEKDRFDDGIGVSDSVGSTLRITNNAFVKYGAGDQRIRGTNSVIIVENGATLQHTAWGAYFIFQSDGEGVVVSNGTLRLSNFYIGNEDIVQVDPSLRIAGDSPRLEVTAGRMKDLSTDNGSRVYLLRDDFTILFDLPAAGYNNGIPLFSSYADGTMLGVMELEESTGGFIITADDKAMRSADSRSYSTHLLAWRPGIDTSNVTLVSGENYSLSYTYGWDEENNLPAGLFEPAAEGDAPTGVWIDARAASGLLIIIR